MNKARGMCKGKEQEGTLVEPLTTTTLTTTHYTHYNFNNI